MSAAAVLAVVLAVSSWPLVWALIGAAVVLTVLGLLLWRNS
ncbi:hypothetical protein ACLM5J_04840 [Nocardioides sp. Bht2]